MKSVAWANEEPPVGLGFCAPGSTARDRLQVVVTRDGDIASHEKERKMPRVSLNQAAPDFSLPDFSGAPVGLSDYRGRKNVLLVFNRTFT